MIECRFHGCCRHLAGPDPVFCDGKGSTSVEGAVGTLHGQCRSYQPAADRRALLATADEIDDMRRDVEGGLRAEVPPQALDGWARAIRVACGGAS